MATELWKGIFKLVEECGEIVQAGMKLTIRPNGRHFDGEDWRKKMCEELADVEAALIYFRTKNLTDDEQALILRRVGTKLHKFNQWGLTGVTVYDNNEDGTVVSESTGPADGEVPAIRGTS